MSASSHLRHFVSALVLATVVAGCGIRVDDQVNLLSQDDHTELLIGTTSTTAPVADPADPGTTSVALFFIGGPDDKLERVERDFASPTTPNDVLAALELGPEQDEIDQFEEIGLLRTFIPAGLSATLGSKNEDFGVQQILVQPEGNLRLILEDQPPPGRLIVKQIVCTVLNLNLDNVSGVEIFDEGEEAIPLTDNDSEPIIGAATTNDFDNCITGTEERQALLEEETNSSSTTTATTTGG